MKDVIRSRQILSQDILKSYEKQDVATVHEAMGQKGAMTHSIRPIIPEMRCVGRALTVQCHSGDNLMLIKAVNMAQPGDVIVADMGNLLDNGPFGEILAVECLTRGVSGLVLSTSIRDSQAIIDRKFSVFSAGVSVFGTSKACKGMINHPVVVGGVLVQPGDLVLGDRDGVVVVPFAEAELILEAANRRREKEAKVIQKLQEGASLFDLYQYQKVFVQLEITEETEE